MPETMAPETMAPEKMAPEKMAIEQRAYSHTAASSRLPDAMRIAREIINDPKVSPSVKAIAASVIRRHGLPPKLDS